MRKRGTAAVTVCSSAFLTLGRAQAQALQLPALPIAVVDHPFGSRTRAEVSALAERCVAQIVAFAAAPAQGAAA